MTQTAASGAWLAAAKTRDERASARAYQASIRPCRRARRTAATSSAPRRTQPATTNNAYRCVRWGLSDKRSVGETRSVSVLLRQVSKTRWCGCHEARYVPPRILRRVRSDFPAGAQVRRRGRSGTRVDGEGAGRLSLARSSSARSQRAPTRASRSRLAYAWSPIVVHRSRRRASIRRRQVKRAEITRSSKLFLSTVTSVKNVMSCINP
jgi:hypothetical protein